MELEADWPEGPHKAQLDALDDVARCPICHDFFNVPLTLGCGHACKSLSSRTAGQLTQHSCCQGSMQPVSVQPSRSKRFGSCAVCSGCIRSNLEFQERTGQAKCPACREKCDSRDLRHNHALKDLVKGYTQTRTLLVAAATQLWAPNLVVAQVHPASCAADLPL